jgi:hypothetical protein
VPLPADRARSYLARQVGTLVLSQVNVENPMAVVRAATWHNVVAGAGIYLPLFVVHDLGVLLTAPRSAGGPILGLKGDLLARAGVSPASPAVTAYGQLLARVASSEVVQKAAGWRLRDDLVGALLCRVLGDVYRRWRNPAKAVGAEALPLEPVLYAGADPAEHWRAFDPEASLGFLEHLAASAWHVYTCVEQIDLDTLKLLGMFRGDAEETAGALALPDLASVLGSPEANDVVNFSLDLMPSVLETKRSAAAQAFAIDGYTSVERRGNIDSLVLSELAHDDEVFDQKLLDAELYYYGHERQREDERRLQLILVDASASMRGQRTVFARGLALALAKKQVLLGDEVWMRFFDSRLYDVVPISKTGSSSVPYLLAFRSERGRNYGRVFRQLVLEVGRMRRDRPRRILVTIITHGQCHIPTELVSALHRHAFLFGVIILPSSEVSLDWLPLLDRQQIVSAEAMASRTGRKDRALDILAATGSAAASVGGQR